jgi:hypothetical protein
MTLKQNASLDRKDTDMLTVFKPLLNEHLNLARIRLICMFIQALCKIRHVNYSKLSSAFDNEAKAESNSRRIQRFMQVVELPMKVVAKIIFQMLPNKESVVLLMDRTNWKLGDSNINILMLAVSYKNISFPLMFIILDKRGNSSTKERISLIQDFIDWFGLRCIDCLIADREFVGKDWVGFLNENNIRYFIRIRNNFKVKCPRKQSLIPAWHYFNHLKLGQLHHLSKIFEIGGEHCYLSGCKSIVEGKVEYLIIISYNKPEESIEYYKKRWQIESMFRAFKSSGFNLEDTHVTKQDRLAKLIMLTMLAFVWCYKIGDYIDQHLEPIIIKKHGRRAKSIFRLGLDAISRYLLSGVNRYNLSFLKFLSCT